MSNSSSKKYLNNSLYFVLSRKKYFERQRIPSENVIIKRRFDSISPFIYINKLFMWKKISLSIFINIFHVAKINIIFNLVEAVKLYIYKCTFVDFCGRKNSRKFFLLNPFMLRINNIHIALRKGHISSTQSKCG